MKQILTLNNEGSWAKTNKDIRKLNISTDKLLESKITVKNTTKKKRKKKQKKTAHDAFEKNLMETSQEKAKYNTTYKGNRNGKWDKEQNTWTH